MEKIECLECGKPFTPKHLRASAKGYCSSGCREDAGVVLSDEHLPAMTFVDIGALMGMSHQAINEIEKTALRRLVKRCRGLRDPL